MLKKRVKLGDRFVGPEDPVYIIAEGGLSNWGDVELAKLQVDAAMAAGADAIKFQAQSTDELVSKKVDPNWYKRLKYKELSYENIKELWKYCEIRNIQCFITAHTEIDLDFLDNEINVPFFKVGSGESINKVFLKNVAQRKKPIIISFGLHYSLEEIAESIKVLTDNGAKDIVILHCLTTYPSPPESCNLKMIDELKKKFKCPVGYSDHSRGIHIPIAAVTLGAKIIEKHLSFNKFDKRSFDNAGSCLPEDLVMLVDQIRDIELAINSNNASRKKEIQRSRKWASQSIVASKTINKGEKISKKMIALKRPGVGLSPSNVSKIIGKKTRKKIYKDYLILNKDLH
tara:strand:- start:24710 stop:25738 length:1029 start_codon:yes stop_codon:yes gene_type:complete